VAIITRRPADRRLIACSRLVENLAFKVPQLIDKLERERDAAMHGGDVGERVRVSGSGSGTTTVEGAILSRETKTEDLDHVYKLVDDIAVRVANELRWVERKLGQRETIEANEPIDRALCSCHGQEGAIEWGEFDCTDRPVRDGLCMRCWHRRYRWRKRHGLEVSAADDAGDPMPDGYHTTEKEAAAARNGDNR
jgi:hypothetical protein